MFGGAKPVKMPKLQPRVCPAVTDIHMACPNPYCYAHPGRRPNTNQQIRMVEYKRRKDEAYDDFVKNLSVIYKKDKFTTKFDKHAEKRRFQGNLRKRVNIRMEEYDESIDRRREKLKALFAKEEREFYKESVDQIQRGGESRMQEMKEEVQRLVMIREQDRQALLKQKRAQQYRNRSEGLRTALAQKNLIECKNSQLQQMRENQAQREAEKELDRLWYDVTVKDIGAKTERTEYNLLVKKQKEKGLVESWDLQIRANGELKAEIERMVEEERVELAKLKAQMEREEYEALMAKERKRISMSKELEELLQNKEKFLAQRKKEEDALTRAFTMLGQMELDRERAKIQNTTAIAKEEMAQFRKNLEDLENERLAEEARADELLQKFMKEAQQKQDDAKCKVELAKRKMLRDVLEGRANQIKEKRALAEEQLKMTQAENEFTRISFETNERLAAEMWRQQKMAKKKYQCELLKQIEYQQYLQKKEKEKLERQLAVGMEEEQRYLKMIEEFCEGTSGAKKHPFRCIIERYDCNCPENEKK